MHSTYITGFLEDLDETTNAKSTAFCEHFIGDCVLWLHHDVMQMFILMNLV